MFPNPVAREVMDASFHARHLLTSGGTAEDLAAKNWKYGIGGYAPDSKISYSLTDSIVVAADWVGFLCLFGASIVLMAKLFGFKGPDGDSDYFVGYREEKVLCIFVNLIAALTYWGRVCSHFNGDVGLAVNVNYYKYFDYLFTCPLLTLDLLWSLNLPYKVTYSGFVALIMVCGTFCNMMEPPARYLWFVMAFCLFFFTWYNIIRLVYARFQQFMNDDAKKIRAPLKLSLTLYFTIWCGYPVLWILDEWGLMPGIAIHVISMIMDVAAKSVYGFALLKFQLSVDKNEFELGELKTLRGGVQQAETNMIRPSKSKQYFMNYGEGSPMDGFPTRNSRMYEEDGQKSEEIEATMSQIADLNKQLATLTAQADQ